MLPMEQVRGLDRHTIEEARAGRSGKPRNPTPNR